MAQFTPTFPLAQEDDGSYVPTVGQPNQPSAASAISAAVTAAPPAPNTPATTPQAAAVDAVSADKQAQVLQASQEKQAALGGAASGVASDLSQVNYRNAAITRETGAGIATASRLNMI